MGLYKNLAISPDKLIPDDVDWDTYAGTEADRPVRKNVEGKDHDIIEEDEGQDDLDDFDGDDDDDDEEEDSIEVDSDDEEEILSSEFAALGLENLRSQILSNAHALALAERFHSSSEPIPPLKLVLRRHGDNEYMAMVLQDRSPRLASAAAESAQQAMMSLLELTAELLEEACLAVEKDRVRRQDGTFRVVAGIHQAKPITLALPKIGGED